MLTMTDRPKWGMARFHFNRLRQKISNDVDAGLPITVIYKKFSKELCMSYSQFRRYVRSQLIYRPVPTTKLSPGRGIPVPPPPAAEMLNERTVSATLSGVFPVFDFDRSLSATHDIDFTPARKGDADRLFKRAKKDKE